METSLTPITSCPSCGTRNRVPADASGRPRCASCQADLPWFGEAGSTDYADVVDNSPLPVLLDCWAPWCGPCHMVGPIVEKMADRYAGRLKVVKVNVDEAPDVAARLGVQGIPAMFILRDGLVVDQIVGAVPEQTLVSHLDAALGS